MASLYTALEISILGTNSGESKGFSHMTCRPDRAIMKSGYTNWKHFAKHQLQCVCMCVWAQLFSHSALCDPMDCSQPGSSVYGIFQARKLEWVAISYSRGSSQPRDQTHVPCIGRQKNLNRWTTMEVPKILLFHLSKMGMITQAYYSTCVYSLNRYL